MNAAKQMRDREREREKCLPAVAPATVSVWAASRSFGLAGGGDHDDCHLNPKVASNKPKGAWFYYALVLAYNQELKHTANAYAH